MSDSFYLAAGIALAALILFTAGVSRAATKNYLGILIDGRGRYSLMRFQIIMWTLLVISTLVGISFATRQLPAIPSALLALMGVTVGTAAVAGAVKNNKDLDPNARVARAGAHALSDGTTRTIIPKLAQLYLEEEGDRADVKISITKFQLFLFTVVLGVIYVALAVDKKGFPDFSNGVIWLLGISHAGYIGGKVPNRS